MGLGVYVVEGVCVFVSVSVCIAWFDGSFAFFHNVWSFFLFIMKLGPKEKGCWGKAKTRHGKT